MLHAVQQTELSRPVCVLGEANFFHEVILFAWLGGTGVLLGVGQGL